MYLNLSLLPVSMDWKNAKEILDFRQGDLINKETIRKQYHKMALKNHPDKNQNSQESKEIFQKIQEAYQFLDKFIESPHASEETFSFTESYSFDFSEEDSQNSYKFGYKHILQQFISSCMTQENKSLFEVVKELVVSGCKNISSSLFEKLERDDAIEVFSFLCKYHTILHIDNSILEQVKEIVAKKFENVQVFLLNPSLKDLLWDNLYKLKVEEGIYLVPLWQNEVYFDGKEDEIIVKCIPDLPERTLLDEHNGLHVYIEKPFKLEYLDTNTLSFELEGKTFEIHNLEFKRTHTYYLANQGIPFINDTEYEVLNESSVIKRAGIHVTLTFTE